MEIFLIIGSLISLILGSLLLLSPESVQRLSSWANQVAFTVDDKIHNWRRPLGIILLALSIFLWYVGLWS